MHYRYRFTERLFSMQNFTLKKMDQLKEIWKKFKINK